MKSKVLFFGAAFLLILFAKGWAADILGNWIANIPGSPGTVETIFSFKVDGTKPTGIVSNPQGKSAISEGEINGDKISFAVIASACENGMTSEYKGKVSLNEIQFRRKQKDGTGQLAVSRCDAVRLNRC